MIVGHLAISNGIETYCSGRYIIVDSGINNSANQLHSLTILKNNLAFDYAFSGTAANHPIEIHKKWLPLTPKDPLSVDPHMQEAYAFFHTDPYPDAY